MLRWSAGSRGPGPWGAGAQGLRPLGWDHDDIRGRARVCPAPRPAVMGTAPPPYSAPPLPGPWPLDRRGALAPIRRGGERVWGMLIT